MSHIARRCSTLRSRWLALTRSAAPGVCAQAFISGAVDAPMVSAKNCSRTGWRVGISTLASSVIRILPASTRTLSNSFKHCRSVSVACRRIMVSRAVSASAPCRAASWMVVAADWMVACSVGMSVGQSFGQSVRAMRAMATAPWTATERSGSWSTSRRRLRIRSFRSLSMTTDLRLTTRVRQNLLMPFLKRIIANWRIELVVCVATCAAACAVSVVCDKAASSRASQYADSVSHSQSCASTCSKTDGSDGCTAAASTSCNAPSVKEAVYAIAECRCQSSEPCGRKHKSHTQALRALRTQELIDIGRPALEVRQHSTKNVPPRLLRHMRYVSAPAKST